MGVPNFFSWLTTKYPRIITRKNKNGDENVSGAENEPKLAAFDNLYLDMNGFIHEAASPIDR